MPAPISAFQVPSPVLLSSNCSVALGNNASPDMTQLAYPYRKAILIDEIRFDLSTPGANSQFNLGAFVYAKFTLGQHYLMRDAVPIWLLGTMMDLAEEEQLDSYVSPSQLISHYRWRLAEPLYIEAGQTLRPVFNRVAIPTALPSGNITVQVSYAGRVVPPSRPRPSSIVIPYAAPFVTTFGQIYQQSNEYHLFNPFDQPVHVQRLTGRVFQNEANVPNVGVAVPAITATVPTSALNVLIDDSWGGKIVNNQTGPGDVFDALRAAWTFDTVMPAKGQYNVRTWNIPSNQQLHIGMIGSREETL